MDDAIAFCDQRRKIVDQKLEPIVACRCDEESCFGASSKDEIVEVTIGHLARGLGGGEKYLIVASSRFLISSNFVPVVGTAGECRSCRMF